MDREKMRVMFAAIMPKVVITLMMLMATVVIMVIMMINDYSEDYDDLARGQLGSSTWTSCSESLIRTETDPSTSRFITATTTIIIIIIICIIIVVIVFMIIKEFMIATDMSSCGDPAEKLR